MIEISDSDIQHLIRLLESGADLIYEYVPASQYLQTDKARQMRILSKKIKRKLNNNGKNNQ